MNGLLGPTTTRQPLHHNNIKG